MGGSNTISSNGFQSAVYGTSGIFAPGNIPGSRSDAASWTDGKGNLWLFGGWDINSAVGPPVCPGGACVPGGTVYYYFYSNELWEFDPSTNEWAWMGKDKDWGNCSTLLEAGGDGTYCASPGVYGTLQTAASENTPGSRSSAVSWADKSDSFWIFGGNGVDATGNLGYLNDLWKFNPSTNEWTWMSGSSLIPASNIGPVGVYGALGTPAVGNTPGGRSGASSWTDHSGNFWLFGGQGWDANGAFGELNDLWEFNPSTYEWSWMGGSNSTIPGPNIGPVAVYGTLGMPAAGNIPGGRYGASNWIDGSGSFWLFGGLGFAATANQSDYYANIGFLNDLWEFSPSTNEWTWMGGSMLDDVNGVYGTLGRPAPSNIPESSDDSTAWTDTSGNFWLFEYSQGSHLWEFSPSMNEWTWMGGNNVVQQPGVWGTLGTPAAANYPGFRTGAMGWTDNGGNLWLFGGAGADSTGQFGGFNDLWVYQPYPQAATPVFSVAAGAYTAAQTVAISDATPGALVYYTTDGTTPTNSSAQYASAITVSATETVQAVAVAPQFLASTVSSAAYVINLPLPDFSVAAAPALFTVSAGQSGTTSVSITPANGFNSAVSFACSGLPSGASCSFSPATITPSGASASTTLTIATSAAAAALHYDRHPLVPIGALACAFLWCGLRNRRHLRMVALLAVSIAGFSLINACGGNSGSGSGLGGGSHPVTSTITVTASAGALQHNATISLTVN
jgi:N-acetylneuraminic acid mutarotase